MGFQPVGRVCATSASPRADKARSRALRFFRFESRPVGTRRVAQKQHHGLEAHATKAESMKVSEYLLADPAQLHSQPCPSTKLESSTTCTRASIPPASLPWLNLKIPTNFLRPFAPRPSAGWPSRSAAGGTRWAGSSLAQTRS